MLFVIPFITLGQEEKISNLDDIFTVGLKIKKIIPTNNKRLHK